jgi:hypothetical protein
MELQSEKRSGTPRIEPNREAITAAANNKNLHKRRYRLAKFSSDQLAAAATELDLLGRIVGSDRVDGTSPFGDGSDETVAVSVLLRIEKSA